RCSGFSLSTSYSVLRLLVAVQRWWCRRNFCAQFAELVLECLLPLAVVVNGLQTVVHELEERGVVLLQADAVWLVGVVRVEDLLGAVALGHQAEKNHVVG